MTSQPPAPGDRISAGSPLLPPRRGRVHIIGAFEEDDTGKVLDWREYFDINEIRPCSPPHRGEPSTLGFCSTHPTMRCRNRCPGLNTQTGHRAVTVLRGYIQRATVFEDNAAARLGL
jgi:hypothetical protein